MDAGVDDEPRRPQGLQLEHSEPLIVAREEGDLICQTLGVQTPPFDERGGDELGAEAADRGAVTFPLQVLAAVRDVYGDGTMLRTSNGDGEPRP
jgi:hypothetical protein